MAAFGLNRVRQLGVLAIVLAAMLFFVGGRAEAATHAAHQPAAQSHAHATHAAHHPAQPVAAAGHHQHQSGGGVHHDGGCHCMSASCVPVLPVTVSDLRVHMPRLRHAAPVAQSALALAGVDPPAKPPRV